MSEAVKRHLVMAGSECSEMVYAADHDRIVAGLRAEVERLRKDAERYRWLDSRKRWPSAHVDFNRDGRYLKHRICWYSGDGWSDATGQTLTEAIDAAMEASHDGRTEDGNG